ncbi:MAG: hypothetical protein V1649_00200 [Patescibacteria group bacterium]
MFDYLQKFSALPKELRDEISSPTAMVVIDELEKKYKLNLAAIVIKIIIKDIKINNLVDYFVSVEKIDIAIAKELSKELTNRLFYSLSNYLGIAVLTQEKKVLPIEQLASVVEKKEIYNQSSRSAIDETAVKSANFFFSPDDETEIRELAKKINNYATIALPEEYLLDQIISKAEINFGSETLAERFKQILKIYLRGIRNKIETKQTLIKSFENGGLSFDEVSAEQVLFIVDDSLKNANQSSSPQPLERKTPPPPLVSVEEATPPLSGWRSAIDSLEDIGARDFEYDLATLVKQKKESPHIPSYQGGGAVKPVELIKKSLPQLLKKDVFQKDIGLPQRLIIRPRTEPDNKVKMEDVKFVPRVMGPIEELRYLDLINFRRLSLEPKKATKKIKEKINLLEEDSYAKRLEGIKAWRSCAVSKLYLDIGHASISAKKPIDVIIEERKKKKQDYLTTLEFETIADFNKSLRF